MQLLHSLGARKVMVFGLGPMGCIPLQRVLSTSGDCQEKTNKLALSFNQQSIQLVEELNNNLPNASFKFGDAYDVVNDVIANPTKYGKSLHRIISCKLYICRGKTICKCNYASRNA